MQSLFFLLLVAVASAKVSYDGHQLWRIQNEYDKVLLNDVINGFDLDVWGHSTSSMDVRVSPDDIRRVRVALAGYRFRYEVIIPDIGVLLKEEERQINNQPREINFTQYNTFEDIEAYLQSVASSSDLATLSSLGQTLEGRELWQLKISAGAGREPLWLDFNIHAREWITGATALYGIDLITNNYGTDPNVTALLDRYDLYILTIHNPDGYAFTWSTDRLWRKNRNKYPNETCAGVDINRNFDDHFGGEGTSNSSCAQTYHGPSPASELETQAVQNGLKALIDSVGLNILFSIHSYGQLWMYPYGYTSDLPPNADELNRVAKIGVDAITAVHGTPYEYGPLNTALYPAASTTIDYGYALGLQYSYTIEVRDKGLHGFLLPADQIIPTAEETWAGIITAVLEIQRN